MPQNKSLFSLEAVFAKKGDSLLLHYGPWDSPDRILIDGGPRGVYKRFLKPRLMKLREEFGLEEDDSLPFKMVMVSHVDDDHIAGIIDLFKDQIKAANNQEPRPYEIGTLWHNSFDDLVGSQEESEAIVSRMAARAASSQKPGLPIPKNITEESKAVVASTAQGRTLRKAAARLNVKVNKPFSGLIMSPAPKKITLGHGLSFTVIGPDQTRIKKFQTQWKKDLKKILKKEKKVPTPLHSKINRLSILRASAYWPR